MDIANPLLRDHVTSAAFVLNLGKTHVAALVRLDLELAAEVRLHAPTLRVGGVPHVRLHSLDVPGRDGLIRRGLVAHVYEQNKHRYVVKPGDESSYRVGAVDHDRMPVGQCWNITRAGRLVCELLTECGLYQEYAGPLMPLIEASRTKRAPAA